jgi:hypothetical protein
MASGTIKNSSSVSGIGATVDLSNYPTTGSIAYTAPTDGYVRLTCNYQTANFAGVHIGTDSNPSVLQPYVQGNNTIAAEEAVFIKKGLKLKALLTGDGRAVFYGLI